MIEMRNLTRQYGDVRAIDGLNLTLREHKIYCLLGRNGAGKTTLMRLIAGEIAPSVGAVYVDGKKVDTLNMPENVRYIEAARSQFNMRVIDLINLAAGVSEGFDMDFALEMARRFRLDQHKKYRRLSFGMRTMVTTLLSLAGGGDVILLDEPVLGFDAIMRAQFYELLQESYAARPRTIIISTHLIDEIAGVAEQILMIDGGRLLLNEDINAIAEKAYRLSGLTEAVEAAAQGLNVVCREPVGKFENLYVYGERTPVPAGVDAANVSLQELFVKMIGGQSDD